MSAAPDRELVSNEPFTVVTHYGDTDRDGVFDALELDGEYYWTVLAWPNSETYVRLADGSVVSLDAFSSSDEEDAS